MRPGADYWIKKLQLEKHLEGGYFHRTYAAGFVLEKKQLPASFKGERPIATAIYFLLEQNQFSALHRIASDEAWHFYFGDSLVIYEISPSGLLHEHLLGNNPEKGDQFQCVIPAGHWFGAKLSKGSEYALLGCTVSPGFDFEEFELAIKDKLSLQYPQHTDLINSLTR